MSREKEKTQTFEQLQYNIIRYKTTWQYDMLAFMHYFLPYFIL